MKIATTMATKYRTILVGHECKSGKSRHECATESKLVRASKLKLLGFFAKAADCSGSVPVDCLLVLADKSSWAGPYSHNLKSQVFHFGAFCLKGAVNLVLRRTHQLPCRTWGWNIC